MDPSGHKRNTHSHHPRLFWAGIGLAILILFLIPLPALAQRPVEHIFHIEAGNFEYRPGTLRVNPGDTVTLELAATDVVHGLYIDGYNLEVVADPGQTARLTFVADRPGAFRFRCSVTCGALHPFMIGKLNVGTNWLLWKAAGAALLVALAGIWSFRR